MNVAEFNGGALTLRTEFAYMCQHPSNLPFWYQADSLSSNIHWSKLYYSLNCLLDIQVMSNFMARPNFYPTRFRPSTTL
jgi:hypothetical protein